MTCLARGDSTGSADHLGRGVDDDAERFYQHFGFTATPRQARRMN